jgi:hypothetical protein
MFRRFIQKESSLFVRRASSAAPNSGSIIRSSSRYLSNCNFFKDNKDSIGGQQQNYRSSILKHETRNIVGAGPSEKINIWKTLQDILKRGVKHQKTDDHAALIANQTQPTQQLPLLISVSAIPVAYCAANHLDPIPLVSREVQVVPVQMKYNAPTVLNRFAAAFNEYIYVSFTGVITVLTGVYLSTMTVPMMLVSVVGIVGFLFKAWNNDPFAAYIRYTYYGKTSRGIRLVMEDTLQPASDGFKFLRVCLVGVTNLSVVCGLLDLILIVTKTKGGRRICDQLMGTLLVQDSDTSLETAA